MFEFLLHRHLPDRTLTQYRAGLLDKECSDMLEAHLLLCPTCQLQLEDLAPPTVPGGLLQFCGGRPCPVNSSFSQTASAHPVQVCQERLPQDEEVG